VLVDQGIAGAERYPVCKARKLMDISRSKPPSDASFAMSDEADQNGSALYVQPANVIAALEREVLGQYLERFGTIHLRK
jgi:hypothetical protein